MGENGGTMTGAPPSGALLTIREAADFLRLSPRTVRELLRREELEGRLIGGRWRFRRQDLLRFFEDAPRSWEELRSSASGE